MNDFDNLTPVTVGAIMQAAWRLSPSRRSNHNTDGTSIMAEVKSSRANVRGQISRPSDEQITEAYRTTGNVWKAADILGTSGQVVQKRLAALGIARQNPRLSPTEIDRLKSDYVVYRDGGRLDELATEMGRSKTLLCRKARSLGLTTYKHTQAYSRVWEGIAESDARTIFDRFRDSIKPLSEWCQENQIGEIGFWRTMEHFFPDEWESIMEARQAVGTPYQIGRKLEYLAMRALKERDWIVFRSPRSWGPVDVAAIRGGVLWLIQVCERMTKSVSEWNALIDLAASVRAVPIIATKHTGEFRFHHLTGHKDQSRRAMPWQIVEP